MINHTSSPLGSSSITLKIKIIAITDLNQIKDIPLCVGSSLNIQTTNKKERKEEKERTKEKEEKKERIPL